MICYKCGQEVGNAKRCPNCGADLSVFLKVRHISNAYYNLGLEQAGVRNLSGAIVSLKNSLKFNKYNIDARNLLGLIYCETGEVVDALSVNAGRGQLPHDALRQCTAALGLSFGFFFLIHSDLRSYGTFLS